MRCPAGYMLPAPRRRRPGGFTRTRGPLPKDASQELPRPGDERVPVLLVGHLVVETWVDNVLLLLGDSP